LFVWSTNFSNCSSDSVPPSPSMTALNTSVDTVTLSPMAGVDPWTGTEEVAELAAGAGTPLEAAGAAGDAGAPAGPLACAAVLVEGRKVGL